MIEYDDDPDLCQSAGESDTNLTDDAAETLPLTVCPQCGGPAPIFSGGGYSPDKYARSRSFLDCEACAGIGYVSVPVTLEAMQRTRPGSEQRVAIFCARERAGLTVFPEVPMEALQWD